MAPGAAGARNRAGTDDRAAALTMERDPLETEKLDLTVVTPSYGYAHYLRDAIVSVAEQQGITAEHVDPGRRLDRRHRRAPAGA